MAWPRRAEEEVVSNVPTSGGDEIKPRYNPRTTAFGYGMSARMQKALRLSDQDESKYGSNQIFFSDAELATSLRLCSSGQIPQKLQYAMRFTKEQWRCLPARLSHWELLPFHTREKRTQIATTIELCASLAD